MNTGVLRAEDVIRQVRDSGLGEAAQGAVIGALAVMSHSMLPLAQKVIGALPRQEQQGAARLLGEMIGEALAGALKDGWPTS